jgi:hypothetical protein
MKRKRSSASGRSMPHLRHMRVLQQISVQLGG